LPRPGTPPVVVFGVVDHGLMVDVADTMEVGELLQLLVDEIPEVLLNEPSRGQSVLGVPIDASSGRW